MWFSAPVWSPFSFCSLSNPFRSYLTFSFSSSLSNRLIFPLLSSLRRSDFKSTSQEIQEAGHRNKHQGKGSQCHNLKQLKKMDNCICTKGKATQGGDTRIPKSPETVARKRADWSPGQCSGLVGHTGTLWTAWSKGSVHRSHSNTSASLLSRGSFSRLMTHTDRCEG